MDDEDDEEEDDDDDDDDAADGVVDTEQLTAAPASGASTPPLFYSSKGYHQITTPSELSYVVRRCYPFFLSKAPLRETVLSKRVFTREPRPPRAIEPLAGGSDSLQSLEFLVPILRVLGVALLGCSVAAPSVAAVPSVQSSMLGKLELPCAKKRR